MNRQFTILRSSSDKYHFRKSIIILLVIAIQLFCLQQLLYSQQVNLHNLSKDKKADYRYLKYRLYPLMFRGTILNLQTNEPAIFTKIEYRDSIIATTDFDGNFYITTEPPPLYGTITIYLSNDTISREALKIKIPTPNWIANPFINTSVLALDNGIFLEKKLLATKKRALSPFASTCYQIDKFTPISTNSFTLSELVFYITQ